MARASTRSSTLSRKAANGNVRTIERAGTIDFELCRKKVKNLNLRILPNGEVRVSAPMRMSMRHIKEFVSSKSDWIARVREQYARSPMSSADCASDKEKTQWKNIVSAIAPPLVGKWEGILKVQAKKIVYRDMKSRWGSCQPETGRICLNTRLALYPPECLEYVVVHELCHFLVRGHGSDFHELMDSVMPDWKRRRAKLR